MGAGYIVSARCSVGPTSECVACGCEFYGFPPFGMPICKPCEAEVMEGMESWDREDDPDPGGDTLG
jgi:hypothetical protein